MAFDYLNSVVESIVARGLEGKVIMVYGPNNQGKSKQATKFPSPVVLPFESSALNAIGGTPKLPVSDWASFRNFTDSIHKDKVAYEKDLMSLKSSQSREVPDDKEKAKELKDRIDRLQKKVDNSPYAKFKEKYRTIVIDTVTALDKSVKKYILDEAGVQQMKDVEFGQLYQLWEDEAYHTFNKFFGLGDFTYLVLAHDGIREIGKDEDDEPIYQAYPMGDKRVVKPIINLCDIVVYLKGNGSDEDHRVINSSAILGECNLCFARSKWDNMDLYIEEFSAESLEAVINKAINEQEADGVKVGSHREQQQAQIEKLTVNWEEVKDKILAIAKKVYQHDDEDLEGVNMTKYFEIVEEFLGVDGDVKETNAKQVGSLQNILSRVEDLVEELV